MKNKSGECRAAVYVTDRAPENTAIYGYPLGLLDALLKEVPVFLLKCNMDPSAAHVSYDGIEEYYRQNPIA